MRANAHRDVLDSTGLAGREIAASPDTPGRPERWSWDIRVLPGSSERAVDDRAGLVSESLGPSGEHGLLEVRTDPRLVHAAVEIIELRGSQHFERDLRELTTLLVARGEVDLEGRHTLRSGDAVVLGGDDPLEFTVTPGGEALVAVVRLKSPQGDAISWVP